MSGWQLLQRPEVSLADLLVNRRQQLHSCAAFGEVADDLLIPRFAVSFDKSRKESLAVVWSQLTNRCLNFAQAGHGTFFTQDSRGA